MKAQTRNRTVGELDRDVVISRFGWQVFNRAAAVTVVPAVHLRLRRTLNGQTKAALSCTASLDGEYLRLVCVTAIETWNAQL